MGSESTSDWLGIERAGERWKLTVESTLVSGADALFGGCATAAAIAVSREVAAQPVIWVSSHFGAFAKRGAEVELRVRTISAGRTMTHLEVIAVTDGRESFTARVAAGDRPAHEVQGQWSQAPVVVDPTAALPFDHPVHEGTWAARFEWRLAANGEDAAGPWAAWWVRPREDIDPYTEAAVVCDYITYGMGRALQQPMGGVSVDNVLRFHAPHALTRCEWRLLEVRPESIAGGFGFGSARLFADGVLAATGSQTTVVNKWDWRLPSEHEAASATA